MGCLQQLMHHVDPATVRKNHKKNYPRRPPKPGPGLPKTCQNPSPRRPGEPRCSQEAPKTSQQAPKSAQGAAKKRPRGAQERPRAAQERPRRAQEAPRGLRSQNRSKTSLTSPRGNFGHNVGGNLCVKVSWNDFSMFFQHARHTCVC